MHVDPPQWSLGIGESDEFLTHPLRVIGVSMLDRVELGIFPVCLLVNPNEVVSYGVENCRIRSDGPSAPKE